MRVLLIIGFSLTCLAAMAQKITLSNSVIDKDTREPLPFASVGIKGKTIGTITNLDGAFDFYVPEEYRNEILVISMLGYKNFESPVWSVLSEGPLLIEMTKSTTVLDEVVVKDLYTGGDILNIALSRIEQNYPMQPFLLEGFYRDIKRVSGTNVALLEAAVEIYDQDYSEPRNKLKLRERVKLLEVRKSIGYDNKFANYFDQTNFLEDLLLHNDVRYRQLDTREEMHSQIIRSDDSFYNGKEIYVLLYNNDYSLKLFIEKTNFSIIHLEYEIGSTANIVEKRKDLISRFSGLKKAIDFRQVGNHLFLSFINMSTKVTWHDAKTNELKFTTELLQQLLINQIIPNTNNRISSDEKMRNYSLQYQDLPYNKTFWENYNVIKDTPLDKKILEDLEKAGPLQKQFEGKQ